MALSFLTKNGYVAVVGKTAATKSVRLTKKGSEARDGAGPLHTRVEKAWRKRFGGGELTQVRSSLERVLGQREALSQGLEPYPDGWRASKPYLEQTHAVLADPLGRLPAYPMVLHRGGWPDGS